MPAFHDDIDAGHRCPWPPPMAPDRPASGVPAVGRSLGSALAHSEDAPGIPWTPIESRAGRCLALVGSAPMEPRPRNEPTAIDVTCSPDSRIHTRPPLLAGAPGRPCPAHRERPPPTRRAGEALPPGGTGLGTIQPQAPGDRPRETKPIRSGTGRGAKPMGSSYLVAVKTKSTFRPGCAGAHRSRASGCDGSRTGPSGASERNKAIPAECVARSEANRFGASPCCRREIGESRRASGGATIPNASAHRGRGDGLRDPTFGEDRGPGDRPGEGVETG